MKKILLLFGLFVFITSCEKLDNSDNGDYAEYLSDNSISTDINFYPREIYENSNVVDTPSLKLYFKTATSYPCINYGISICSIFENNELILRFDSIIQSNICLTAIGPATAYIDLPSSAERLVLLNGNSVDKYELDITEEKVIIHPLDNAFSYLKYSTILRYPENTFVYECNMDTSETKFYNDFLEILTDNLSIAEYNFPDEGEKPYAESYTEYNRKSLVKYFQYETEEEFNKAGELLNKFVSENNINKNTSIYINLTSWNNQKYLSWMMSN